MNPEYASRTRRLLLAGALSTLSVVAGTAQVEQNANYRPELAVSETLQPFLTQLEPGSDGFPLERQAKELETPLRELSDALRAGGLQAIGAANRLLDPDFRGAPLLPIDSADNGGAGLEVKRATGLPRAATLDARGFGAELQRLIGEFRDVTTAEFLLTSIEPEGSGDPPSSRRAQQSRHGYQHSRNVLRTPCQPGGGRSGLGRPGPGRQASCQRHHSRR